MKGTYCSFNNDKELVGGIASFTKIHYPELRQPRKRRPDAGKPRPTLAQRTARLAKVVEISDDEAEEYGPKKRTKKEKKAQAASTWTERSENDEDSESHGN